MSVVDKVVEEDHRLLLAGGLKSIILPDRTTPLLDPAARDPRRVRYLRGHMHAGKRRASTVLPAQISPQDVFPRPN